MRSAEFWLDTASIREAWQISRGAGQTIAVIDTGIGRGPTVFNGVTGGADFSGVGSSDGRTPVGVIDREHGSLVASVAAGRPSPGDTGMIGVAPEANLLSVSLGFPAASNSTCSSFGCAAAFTTRFARMRPTPPTAADSATAPAAPMTTPITARPPGSRSSE